MNIIHTQYSFTNQSLEVFLAGCNGIDGVHCKGCHNPQSWDFNAGKEIDLEYLVNKANESLVQNIYIMGGEPLDQDEEDLLLLLESLYQCNKPIWLFTRYTLGSISNSIMAYLSYVKSGSYIEELRTENNVQFGINLASSNQFIYKIDRKARL